MHWPPLIFTLLKVFTERFNSSIVDTRSLPKNKSNPCGNVVMLHTVVQTMPQ